MRKFSTMSFTISALVFATFNLAQADNNTDKVVAKMAEGNVSSICSGGRETITAASKKATRALAQAGQISGDFQAIGKKAGSQFYQTKC